MTGYDEFMTLFGDITLFEVSQVFLSLLFLFLLYKRVREYLIQRYEANVARDE